MLAQHGKFITCILFLAICHDSLIAGDHFLHLGVQIAKDHLLFDEVFPHKGGQFHRNDDGQRDGHKRDNRHTPIVGEEHHKCADESQHTRNEGGDGLRNRIGNIVDIVCHTAHDVAAGVIVRIADREVGDLPEQIFAQGEYRRLRNFRGSKTLQHRHEGACHIHDSHQHEIFDKTVEIHMKLSAGQGNRVNGFSLQLWPKKGEEGRDQGGDHDRNDKIFALADVLHQFDDRTLRILRFFPNHRAARTAMSAACAVSLLECAKLIGSHLFLNGRTFWWISRHGCAFWRLTVHGLSVLRKFLFVRHYGGPPSVSDFICEW